MKSIRNVDVLYTIHEKSRVLEECICRVESACDTGHFESVDSALRTKPELWAALGAYIRQLLALLASGGGERLRQAADAAKQGDHARAMELLRPVLNTEQAQALLRKLNG